MDLKEVSALLCTIALILLCVALALSIMAVVKIDISEVGSIEATQTTPATENFAVIFFLVIAFLFALSALLYAIAKVIEVRKKK